MSKCPYSDSEITRSQFLIGALLREGREDEMLAPAPKGHNNPPNVIDSAREAMTELSAFLKGTPAITNDEEAKHGAAYIERTRVALNEMETERTSKVAPLNSQLSAINGAYRAVREPLEKALKVLRQRLTVYAAVEEAKRIAEAERLRQEAEAKEAAAREAERAEQDLIARADVGECDLDVGGAIEEADAAFKDFGKADRAAAVAERNVPVKLGSVMGGKRLSMHTHRVLVIATAADAAQAIVAMGLNDELVGVIVKYAKRFEEEMGELPPGVTETQVRSF